MKVEIFESIQKISFEAWQKLTTESFPFADYEFLLALEETGCLGSRTGWKPFYICCFIETRLAGAFLCFSKTNSYGEYIFDFAWAQAFESYGLRYYPKLVSAIPFTPATGPKLLLDSTLTGEKKLTVARLLLEKSQELKKSISASSLHALFIPETETSIFAQANFTIRHSFQYHWRNENFKDFPDFLSQLRAKRRKEIVRERRQALESGVKISRLTGDQLTPKHAELMYQFYTDTVGKMGGFAYLTKDFFRQVFLNMKHKILFVLAEKESGEPVAGALNYFGKDTLFGRHWGCVEDFKSLHFELCYYQGIEFAIEKKFSLFEAGAQGEHKFQRGFLPSLTYSAHQIDDPNLGPAIDEFIGEEKKQITLLFAQYGEQTPFSREE
jgi:predicted N-acyltransferase